MLSLASFGFFSSQLVFGFHFIYNVEWLGWDLVEPMTYTISQGSFIVGMIAIMRSRYQLANSEYKSIEEYWSKDKLNKLHSKEGSIDLVRTRFKYLETQINKLELQIAEMEREIIIG